MNMGGVRCCLRSSGGGAKACASQSKEGVGLRIQKPEGKGEGLKVKGMRVRGEELIVAAPETKMKGLKVKCLRVC